MYHEASNRREFYFPIQTKSNDTKRGMESKEKKQRKSGKKEKREK
jgi:hypothetical protein